MWIRGPTEFRLCYGSYDLKTLCSSCFLKWMISRSLTFEDCRIEWNDDITLMNSDCSHSLIPSFAWTALLGFQSTGIPFFAWAALSGFRLTGCTFFFIPNFCPNPFFFFGSSGCPFFPGLSFFFVQRFNYAMYFLTASELTWDGKSSPSMVVSIKAPPEKTFLTTYGPS